MEALYNYILVRNQTYKIENKFKELNIDEGLPFYEQLAKLESCWGYQLLHRFDELNDNEDFILYKSACAINPHEKVYMKTIL